MQVICCFICKNNATYYGFCVINTTHIGYCFVPWIRYIWGVDQDNVEKVNNQSFSEVQGQYKINGNTEEINGDSTDIQYADNDLSGLNQIDNANIDLQPRKKVGFQKGWKGGNGGARKGAGRKPKTMHDRLQELESDITVKTRETMNALMEIIRNGQTKERIAASELLLKYSIPIPQDPKPASNPVTINNNTVVMDSQSEAQKLLDSRRKARLQIESKTIEVPPLVSPTEDPSAV